MREDMRCLLDEGVRIARALDVGVGGTEEPRRIVLPEPDVEIVVMEILGQQWLVAFHGAIERPPEELWPFLGPCREWHEPLGAHQAELAVRVRLVEQWREGVLCLFTVRRSRV